MFTDVVDTAVVMNDMISCEGLREMGLRVRFRNCFKIEIMSGSDYKVSELH
jgi:hypothetical protein